MSCGFYCGSRCRTSWRCILCEVWDSWNAMSNQNPVHGLGNQHLVRQNKKIILKIGPKTYRWDAAVWVMSHFWYRGSAVLHPSRVKNPWTDLRTAVSPCGAPGVLLRWLREGSSWPVRPPAELHAADRCKEEQMCSQIRTWAIVWRGTGGQSASLQREELGNKLGWTPGSKRDALSSLKAGGAVTAKHDFSLFARNLMHKKTAGQVRFHYSVICLGEANRLLYWFV